MSKTVAAAEAQAHFIEMAEEVAETHVEVVVTQRGKPLVKVIPIADGPRKTLEQMRAEGVKILGDIVEPTEEWDMAK